MTTTTATVKFTDHISLHHTATTKLSTCPDSEITCYGFKQETTRNYDFALADSKDGGGGRGRPLLTSEFFSVSRLFPYNTSIVP